MDSILTSIKKLLGIIEEYEQFDTDLIIHINTVLMMLTQMGVGPDTNVNIVDKSSTWTEWLGDDLSRLASVKTYTYLKVRLIFDPPTNGSVVKSYESAIQEMEFRMLVTTEAIQAEIELAGLEALE